LQKAKNTGTNLTFKHIIIGGNGFLGQEIIRKLSAKKNTNIIVVDLFKISGNKFPFIKCDISKRAQVSKIPIAKNDIVHHLASRLIVPNKPRFGRYRYFESTSIVGTKNILKLMREKNCKKMIFWSSDMVYGIKHTFPIYENDIPTPIGEYGETKLIAEKLVKNEIEKENLKCTIFRPRLIIGTGRLGILKNLFYLAKHNLPIPLIGNGNNFFQFVSVSDCANATILAVQNGVPSKIYNLGSEKPYPTKELLSKFISHINSKSIILPVPSILILSILRFLSFFKISPMDKEQFLIADKNMVLSSLKAYKDLKWKPKDNDLEMLLNAYRTYNIK